jgi:ABC-type branched-subunit amino acid transport system substrate-binding protein
LLAGACGSSSKQSVANSAAGKSTIDVGTIVDLSGPGQTYPARPLTIKAAAAAINKAGGSMATRCRSWVCDDQFNPNVATQCADTMVSHHVVYVTGVSSQGGGYMPVLQAANIPDLTGVPNSAAELSYPTSYALDAGSFVSAAVTEAMCAKRGSTKIGIGMYDVAAAQALLPSIYAAIAAYGLKQASRTEVKIPVDAVDLSSYAAPWSPSPPVYLEDHPELRGALLDQPELLDGTIEELLRLGRPSRCWGGP